MKSLTPFLALFVSLAHAQSNFFINPGSQADQLASGNHTEDYPIYQEGDSQVFSWITDWTVISLLLYQNENASYIRLLDFEEDHPNRYTYDMRPDVDLSWNDVFFLTLWNENNAEDGGPPFIYSSYFRINASDPDSSTSTTTTTTRSTSSSTSTFTTTTLTDSPTPEAETPPPSFDSSSSDDDGDSLSSSAKVGLGVGIGLGVPALALAGVAAFYLRRRSQAAAFQHSQQLLPGAGYAQGTGSGYPSPPVSNMSTPSPFKLGGSSTVPGYSGPIEADGTGLQAQVQTQHQSRFQELPASGGVYAR
ncbi:hypothetical protein BJX65DRAFT_160521 [Aspergillus insuetus]